MRIMRSGSRLLKSGIVGIWEGSGNYCRGTIAGTLDSRSRNTDLYNLNQNPLSYSSKSIPVMEKAKDTAHGGVGDVEKSSSDKIR